MPKPRHENPYAEQRIVELDLAGWRSRSELAAEAEALAAREREETELRRARWRAARRQAEARRARRAAERAVDGTAEGQRRASELAALASAAERVARAALALVPIPWADLSPAELAFRWMLGHHHCDEWSPPSDYSRWAHDVREAWKTARSLLATE